MAGSFTGQVTNGINAFPFANASVIFLFMDILPSVTCNCCTVLVSSSGNGDNYNLIFAHLRYDLSRVSNCMSTLDCRNNTFCS